VLTQKRLKELLKYDPETGIFTWLVANSPRVEVGDEAGCLDPHGYRQIRVDGKQYRAHRLAFLYIEGYFPEYQVDHKHGDKDDNRWEKLRHVTQSCNMQNQKLNSCNTSGFIGVSWHRGHGKYRTHIMIGRKYIHLGYHSDTISAALARCYYEACCPDWICNHQGVNFVKLRGLGYNV